MIKKQILKKNSYNFDLDESIYIPILLTQEIGLNGVLTSYGEVDEIDKYITTNNQRVLITGYCDSKLNDILIIGKSINDSVGAFNAVGEFITPYGETYTAYSGIVSKNDSDVVYITNCKVVNGVPDPKYGVIYTDSLTNTRDYYNDLISNYDTIQQTTFQFYPYGINGNVFSYNDLLYKDNRNDRLVETLKVDSSEINVDRGDKTPFEMHMILATLKNTTMIK